MQGVIIVFFPLYLAEMDSICQSCRKFKPNRSWDSHVSCPVCRTCSQEEPCSICSQWEPSRWNQVHKFLTERKRKLLEQARACPTPAPAGSGTGPGECEISLSASSERIPGDKPSSKELSKKRTMASDLTKGKQTPLPSAHQDAAPSVSRKKSKGKRPLKGGSKAKSSEKVSTPGTPVVAATPSGSGAQAPSTPAPRAPSSAQAHASTVRKASVQTQAASPSQPPSSGACDFEGFTPEELLETEGPTDTVRPTVRASKRTPASQRHGRPASSHMDSSGGSPSGHQQSSDQLLNLLLQRLSEMVGSSQRSPQHQTHSSPDPACQEQEEYSPGDSYPEDDVVSIESEHEDPELPTASSVPAPRSHAQASSGDSGDDEPLLGTDITSEAFQSAVEVLRRVLGFEVPLIDEGPPTKRSKLTLNKPKQVPTATLPVDIECSERYRAVAEKRKWTAFPARSASTFKVDESEWKELFCPPSIPAAARDKLYSVGAMDSKGKFTSKEKRLLDSELAKIDSAARMGLKFSSALLLMAKVIMLAFQQHEGRTISRKDTGTLVNLLGPTSRLIFDQLARVSVKATSQRRLLVLDSLTWPSDAIKRKFQDIPLSGSDLFDGQFETLLQAEVKRHKDMRDADFRPKRQPSRFPAPGRTRPPSYNSSSSFGRREHGRQPRSSQAFPNPGRSVRRGRPRQPPRPSSQRTTWGQQPRGPSGSSAWTPRQKFSRP